MPINIDIHMAFSSSSTNPGKNSKLTKLRLTVPDQIETQIKIIALCMKSIKLRHIKEQTSDV
jgi:hypothetical protein